MAALKIQDVRPKTWFFLYNSKGIDFKPHKCIEVEYKVGHSGYFDTKDMSVSITVLEIQHIGAYINSRKRGISDSGGNNRSLCDESTKFCMTFCHLISQYESVSQVKVATYDVRHHEQSN